MTDDLKQQFERLVADPPPLGARPSESVFARVRTARRRRTAGVVTLAAAAVVAVAVAAGNLTDINSSPPVTNTPSAPSTVVTGPPTTTPTNTPTNTPSNTQTSTPPAAAGTTATKPATSGVTGAARTTNTPPPVANHTSNTPDAPTLGVQVTLKPTVQGRTLTMKVTVSGTELVPTDLINHRPLSTSQTTFLDLLGGTQYFFGDGGQSGSDAGAVDCLSGTKPTTGRQTYTLQDGSTPPSTHTYAKAGTYTFKYTVRYCGTDGWVPVTKSTKVTIK